MVCLKTTTRSLPRKRSKVFRGTAAALLCGTLRDYPDREIGKRRPQRRTLWKVLPAVGTAATEKEGPTSLDRWPILIDMTV